MNDITVTVLVSQGDQERPKAVFTVPDPVMIKKFLLREYSKTNYNDITVVQCKIKGIISDYDKTVFEVYTKNQLLHSFEVEEVPAFTKSSNNL
jgi:hypothetical protein